MMIIQTVSNKTLKFHKSDPLKLKYITILIFNLFFDSHRGVQDQTQDILLKRPQLLPLESTYIDGLLINYKCQLLKKSMF